MEVTPISSFGAASHEEGGVEMRRIARSLMIGALALAAAGRAAAQDRCSAKGKMGEYAFDAKHCAVALYDDAKSVTLWISATPIPAEEVSNFHLSSYPKDSAPDGKARTTISLSFCPGGGKEAASPSAVKGVEFGLNHASSPMVFRNWLFELPKDKDLKFEKLSGEVKPGGKLSGRITGRRLSDQVPFSWEIDFDVKLPEKSAAAGTTCGG
jgi:hypothetical protein